MEKYKKLKELLSDCENQQAVNNYISYCKSSERQKDKSGKLKNPQFAKCDEEKLAELFRKVEKEGMYIDGKHITIQYNGINYDYVAYKNKMLIAYPETMLDLQLVYKEDEFTLSKNSGKVVYNHEIHNPFEQKDDLIVGGYCVIKNKRGEFVTTLTRLDFDKHKKAAKTSYIWNSWYVEMCLKTLIKKAVKYHFEDIFNEMETEDEKNFDLKPETLN